jgi:hypothetical protein
MAGTKHERQRANQAVDLTGEQLPRRPDPEAAMTRMVRQFERFARANPELAEPLLKKFEAIAEEHAPPEAMRRLTVKEAALRIGVSEGHLANLGSEGRLGGNIEGKRRYSKKECDRYRDGYRLQGRKPKSLMEST